MGQIVNKTGKVTECGKKRKKYADGKMLLQIHIGISDCDCIVAWCVGALSEDSQVRNKGKYAGVCSLSV